MSRSVAKWFGGIALAVLAWLVGVAVWIAVGPEEDAEATADFAVVLGAAVDDDEPSPVFAARIDHAIDIYREGRVDGIFFTGARSPEDTKPEASAARDYAIARGVPSNAIAVEVNSRTTHQNLAEVHGLMLAYTEPRIIIVSDPLHLRRAVQMADDLGFDAQASATPTTRYRSWSTKLPFLLREVYFVHHYWLFGA